MRYGVGYAALVIKIEDNYAELRIFPTPTVRNLTSHQNLKQLLSILYPSILLNHRE